MNDLIKNMLRESLLMELGNSSPYPFQVMSPLMDDERDGLVKLQDYRFKVGPNNTVSAWFDIDYKEENDGLYYITYDFVFGDSRSVSLELTNDMQTMLPKMATIVEIIKHFIELYTTTYEGGIYRLHTIKMYGIQERDKGEIAGSDSQRTKLYDYLIRKNLPTGFSYVKDKNNMSIVRNPENLKIN